MNRILTMLGRTPRIMDHSATGEQADKVETAARVLSTLLLIGGVVGGGALLLQAPPAHAEREVVQAPVVPQAKPAKWVKPNAVVTQPPPLRAGSGLTRRRSRPWSRRRAR